MGRVFPDEWEQFSEAVQPQPGQRLIDAYYERITGSDRKAREVAARAWCDWENVHVSLDPKHVPSARFRDPEFRLLFATLVIHYWKHAGFLEENDILSRMNEIAYIPGVLIHGRLDVSSPLAIAWKLHKAWPASKLLVIDADGHGGETMADAFARELAQS
jgi:proline iminopeptidase